MTPRAPQPREPARDRVAAIVPVSAIPSFRMIAGPGASLAGTRRTAPAGPQEPDGPNIARVYDYLPGGSHNFDADKVAAAEFLARWPDARQTMAANRAFLGRAVRHLAGPVGIRQFLDVGSGIPTLGNVHAIAWQAAPDAPGRLPPCRLAVPVQEGCADPARPWLAQPLSHHRPERYLPRGMPHATRHAARPRARPVAAQAAPPARGRQERMAAGAW